MADEDEQAHAHAFGIPIPAGFVQALRHDHDTAHIRAQDRYNAAMRWLDSLDVEGLMALRWVLSCEADDAYGNNRHYDGMAMQLLRARGVDPRTGLDPAAQLLDEAAGAAVAEGMVPGHDDGRG